MASFFLRRLCISTHGPYKHVLRDHFEMHFAEYLYNPEPDRILSYTGAVQYNYTNQIKPRTWHA